MRPVYYAFDLLHIDGWDISNLQLVERKALFEPLRLGKPGLQFNGHEAGDGELIPGHAGDATVIVSDAHRGEASPRSL